MIFSFNLVRSFVIQPFMKSLFIIELNIACNAFFHLSFRPVADSIKLFFFWPFNFFWGLTPPFNFDGGVL